MTYRRRIRLEVAVPVDDPHVPSLTGALPDRRLAGARDVRHVRHRLRRPPGADPHPDARRLGRPPAAQGLPARRHPGAVQGRHHSTAGRAEGLPDDATTRRATRRRGRRPRAASTTSPAATGTRSSAASTRSRTSASSSTWVRSTRRRTACCASCVELEGETVTDCARSSATCTPASRRTSSTGRGRRASPSSPAPTTWRRCSTRPSYCLGVEKLLGVEVPARAQLIRVMMMEINRVSSHWVALATGGMEMGALTAMTNGLRARERCLDVLEMITGLRMNHAYVRPGRRRAGPPRGRDEEIREWIKDIRGEIAGLRPAAARPADLDQPAQGRRLARCRGLHRARGHRADAARRRPAVGPAQGRALPRLRDVRLRGADRGRAATAGRGSSSASTRWTSR